MLTRIAPTAPLVRVLWLSLAMAAYSMLAVWKEQGPFARYGDFSPQLEAVLTLAIGMLLAFRANRAFDRWWEARTLWGTLVNCSRNLAVKSHNVIVRPDEMSERLQRLIIAFPYALRDHLRSGVDPQTIPGLETETCTARHVPSWIVNQIYGIYEVLKQEHRIQYGEFRMLDRESKVLLEVCGACERIRNTPIATSYRVILNHALALFLFTLPWGIVNDFGWLTIPITFLASYFAIGAEGIADHVEHPFQPHGDGLDLDGLCQTIETTVTEIFTTQTVSTPTPKA